MGSFILPFPMLLKPGDIFLTKYIWFRDLQHLKKKREGKGEEKLIRFYIRESTTPKQQDNKGKWQLKVFIHCKDGNIGKVFVKSTQS